MNVPYFWRYWKVEISTGDQRGMPTKRMFGASISWGPIDDLMVKAPVFQIRLFPLFTLAFRRGYLCLSRPDKTFHMLEKILVEWGNHEIAH